ncbi:trihelix transcription factor GT-2-like isoform X2 [Carica papaya]|uniref:trihelix transcription factor GT-2-like isoform X2 n=1 Tax=Carica papaya TaxID=3649 RepID=UPI000B8CA8BB|nr:trihelix transcription factor GT-2-like isoform X2 [Carica papaya]
MEFMSVVNVIRKLSELGYNRSAKKCKEKFENIFKYHRRTKECRSGRSNSKTYRFFEQLEALDNHNSLYMPLPLDSVQTSMPPPINTVPTNISHVNFAHDPIPCSIKNPTTNYADTSPSTSFSSKESDGMHKKKRKLAEFFEGLMRKVMEKQENLQKKFVEAIEKFEQDRIAREEAWKMQELARIKRERELLVQERSVVAAKDAAVLAFLQKFSEQTNSVQMPQIPVAVEKVVERQEDGDGGENFIHQMSSSRWPKEEIEALIKLRANLDTQYDESAPKGPLWEEISAAMKKLGYDRNAKRCKEKWENMNKYFKKVKESNKKRSEDSKTCPYFQQLDALYKEKTRKPDSSVSSGYNMKPEELLMHMMDSQEEQRPDLHVEDGESESADQSEEHRDNEDEGNNYQIGADNSFSMEIIE